MVYLSMCCVIFISSMSYSFLTHCSFGLHFSNNLWCWTFFMRLFATCFCSLKVVLKLNIQKTKIMASGPITSWEIDGETVEIVADFILGGSQITADGDCSHEIKRRLLLGRKVMTNLDSILKSRDITLSTKFRLVKAMAFTSGHVWMWELDYKESWVLKNWCFWIDSWESLGLQGHSTSTS